LFVSVTQAVRLLDYGTFEDKDSAINEDTTGVSEALGKMIVDHRETGQKLAVGNLEYKKIIESTMVSVKLPCLLTSTYERFWHQLLWIIPGYSVPVLSGC
jgi:hypothetical protein